MDNTYLIVGELGEDLKIAKHRDGTVAFGIKGEVVTLPAEQVHKLINILTKPEVTR